MKLLPLKPNSPEWESFRRQRIGASDAAVIMNAHPYKSQKQLWDEKILGKKQYISSAMQRGTDLEAEARRNFELWAEESYEPIVIENDLYPWALASLDGINPDYSKIVEIKCPGEDTFDRVKKGDIPEYWKWQMTHQLAILGKSQMNLYVFDGEAGIVVPFYSDLDDTMKLMQAELAWYKKHILGFQPPEEEIPFRADAEVIEAIEAWKKAKEAREEAEEIEKICKDCLIYLANDKDYQCNGVKVQKIARAGNVIYKKIPQLKDVDLDQYRGEPIVYWSIR